MESPVTLAPKTVSAAVGGNKGNWDSVPASGARCEGAYTHRLLLVAFTASMDFPRQPTRTQRRVRVDDDYNRGGADEVRTTRRQRSWHVVPSARIKYDTHDAAGSGRACNSPIRLLDGPRRGVWVVRVQRGAPSDASHFLFRSEIYKFAHT